jgi:NTE family protein
VIHWIDFTSMVALRRRLAHSMHRLMCGKRLSSQGVQAMTKKTALILSGGGAKGAFQAGAEKYAREVKGYHWDVIAGVSVGALNGSMLAMEKYARLLEIWNTISNDQVYTGGFNLISIIKLLFGARSFYGNAPLQRLLAQEIEPARFQAALRIGAVSLKTGEYRTFTPQDASFTQALLASTVMPIIWTPVDVAPDLPGMVDGGVRNISPIGDVLDEQPDELVIINCGVERTQPLAEAPKDVVKIGLRTLDILLNELFVSDVREFIRINHLVRQAAEHGVTLRHPASGKPLKYYEYRLIEPEEELGDTLDFSQPSVQRSLRMGLEAARRALD